MSRALVILAIAGLSGSLFGQISPATPKAAQGADHRGTQDRVGERVFEDYHLDNEQSWWLVRVLRSRALRYVSE
jgi:hypothetical protein